MILVDTGYLLALFNPADEHHDRAHARAQAINEPLLVTEYVLWEAVNALSRRHLRTRANAIIALIRQDPQFQLLDAEPAMRDAGFDLHRARADKDWSLTDCISFHLMQERDVTQALAHDQHFEQAGFEALLRRDP